MKKLITILALSLGTFYSGAQITLTESNTPRVTGMFPYERITTGIDTPVEGPDKIYDYTNLPSPTSNGFSEFMTPSRTGFTQYTRYENGQTLIANIPISVEYYDNSEASGYYNIGSYIHYMNVNLAPISGSPNDSLVFQAENRILATPSKLIPFPFTYGDSFSQSLGDDLVTNFELTIAGFNLQQTPGTMNEYAIRNLDAVGYGEIILPMTGGQSIPYDVLLIKSEVTVIDSVFLGGSPAPTPIMDAFGLIQGDIYKHNTYRFYAEGLKTAILVITMDDTWSNPVAAVYNPDHLTFDSGVGLIKNEKVNNFKVHPNPASDKITISFDSKDNSNLKLAIYDVTGKEVKSITANKIINSNDKIEIDIQNLSNGTYFVKVNSDLNSVTKKIIVNK